MLTTKRTTKQLITATALVACLAAVSDLAHAQRPSRVARRPDSVTTVTNLDSATRFTREVVSVKVEGSTKWNPPPVQGDSDFSGNGPEVWIRVQFLVHDNTVYRRVYMAAVETRSTLGATLGGDNATTAKGWSPMEKVWAPPAGQMIVQLRGISEKTDLVHEVLRGHRPHVRQTTVGRMQIFADRKGGDTNRYTGVKVDFDYQLPVVVQNATSRYAQVHLPRTVRYDPPLIEGDGDFKGHGPWVTVTVYLTHSDSEVNFVLFMKARETKSDWTTAAGYYTKRIYKAPAGKRIKAIHGKKMWKNVVNYTDNDHEVDNFHDRQLGPIHVEGDGFGVDAPYRGTKVILSNIQHMVLAELENE